MSTEESSRSRKLARGALNGDASDIEELDRRWAAMLGAMISTLAAEGMVPRHIDPGELLSECYDRVRRPSFLAKVARADTAERRRLYHGVIRYAIRDCIGPPRIGKEIRNEDFLEIDAKDPHEGVPAILEKREELERLEAALNETQRIVYNDLLGGVDRREIAERLGRNIVATRSFIMRLRKKLSALRETR